MLTDACSVGVIVPLVDILGNLAVICENMTGQPCVASSPLRTFLREIQVSLDEASAFGAVRRKAGRWHLLFDLWKHGNQD